MITTTIERLDRGGLITRIAFDDGAKTASVSLKIDRGGKFGETFGFLRGQGVDVAICSQTAANLLIRGAAKASTINEAIESFRM